MVKLKNVARRKANPVTIEEVQGALDALIRAADRSGISPTVGSANAMLVKKGAVGPSDAPDVASRRATYVLSLLIKAGAISRLPKSERVRILRTTVEDPNGNGLTKPAAAMPLSTGARERYEETIRRLDAMVASLRAELEDLRAQLADCQLAAGPSGDVQDIMNWVMADNS